MGRRVGDRAAVAGRRRRRRPPVGDPARRAHHLAPADRARDHDRSGRAPACASTASPLREQRADDGLRLARSQRARHRGEPARLPDRRAQTVRYDKAASLSVDAPPRSATRTPARRSAAGRPRGRELRRSGARATKANAGRRRASGERSRFGRWASTGRAHSGRGARGGGRGGGARRRRHGGACRDDHAGRGRRARDGEVDAQVPDHLAADPLDAHQLVDGAERMPLPVADDLRSLGGSDARAAARGHPTSAVLMFTTPSTAFAARAGGAAKPRDRSDTQRPRRAHATHARVVGRGADRFPRAPQAASTAYCVVGRAEMDDRVGFEVSAMLPRVPASRHS